jgi:hypothetical protein
MASEEKHYVSNGQDTSTAPAEALEFGRSTQAKMVDLKFTDLLGSWQHMSLPPLKPHAAPPRPLRARPDARHRPPRRLRLEQVGVARGPCLGAGDLVARLREAAR